MSVDHESTLSEGAAVDEIGFGDMWARTVPVAFAISIMTAGLVFTKTGRDALFFLEDGLFDLPRAYIGIALLSFPTAALVLGTMRRFGPRATRIAGILAAAALLVGYFLVARPGGGALMTAFFMAVPITFGVLFSLSWLLAADLLDYLPKDRLARPYSAIGAASIAGGIVGGFAARALSMQLQPKWFILLGALCLGIAGLALGVAQLRYPARMAPGTTRDEGMVRPSVRSLRAEPYALLLIAVSVTAALTGVLIEFQFFLAAATSGNDGQQNAALFATLYTALNVGALLVQLLLVPVLQRRLGLAGSLLILPGALVGGAVALLANSSLLMRSGLRAAEGGLKASIHRSNWEQAFLSLGASSRNFVKLLVDGLGARVGEGVAALILLGWLSFVVRGDLTGQSITWVTYLFAATASIWLFLTTRLRQSLGTVDQAGAATASPAVPLPDT
ncbi:MAG: hypothetical protein V3U38_06140 [Gemmatimonadota bacterium]